MRRAWSRHLCRSVSLRVGVEACIGGGKEEVGRERVSVVARRE